MYRSLESAFDCARGPNSNGHPILSHTLHQHRWVHVWTAPSILNAPSSLWMHRPARVWPVANSHTSCRIELIPRQLCSKPPNPRRCRVRAITDASWHQPHLACVCPTECTWNHQNLASVDEAEAGQFRAQLARVSNRRRFRLTVQSMADDVASVPGRWSRSSAIQNVSNLHRRTCSPSKKHRQSHGSNKHRRTWFGDGTSPNRRPYSELC